MCTDKLLEEGAPPGIPGEGLLLGVLGFCIIIPMPGLGGLLGAVDILFVIPGDGALLPGDGVLPGDGALLPGDDVLPGDGALLLELL